MMTNRIKIEWHGRNSKMLFRDYVFEFVQYFETSQKSNKPFGKFYGKILRGKGEKEFRTLADNPDRQIVFFLDSIALKDLIGLEGLSMLRHIGYPDPFVQELVGRGTRFKLLVTQSVFLKLATWDNLLDQVHELYPEWRQKIQLARPILKNSTYSEIMNSRGVAKDVRIFLRDSLNVNHLFAGDGYTRSEGNSNQPVYAEYVVRNEKVNSLQSYVLIEFPVINP